MGGVRLDLLPQLVDEYAQVFGVIAIVRAPARLQKPPMFERLALIRYQMAQQIELFGREPDRVALHEKFSSLEINFQVAGNIGGDWFPRRGAPQRRANPRQQL